MLIKSNNLKYILISAASAGSVFLIPAVAKGDVFSQVPVPSYEPISSSATSTQAVIPENLKKEWQGKFTLPTFSLLKQPSWTYKDIVLGKFLNSQKLKPQTRTYSYDPKKIYDWTKQIASSVNTESHEPELTIKNGRATNFVPPTIGKQLDRYQSTLKILSSLELGNSNIELAVVTTQPNRKLEDLNELGIKEIIGRGESKFGGSPANRRHNIKIGVEKMQGVIIQPGEEFSFNKYLGPVEADQGFKPELVIKADGTIPELGGGLCQVSSTTFRAAMHAGLPITQRKNHSYAVQYYAPQGTDATIYPGVIDLKFRNDTGSSILIWPYFKTNDYLVFDFYGTYDGREVKLNQPVAYDKKSDGSMKATWTRSITKNGETTTDKFASNYLPPALFHKNEQFVNNNGTVTGGDTNTTNTTSTTNTGNSTTNTTNSSTSEQ
jgi:vancomycin resistance protein YoaR